MRVLMAHNFYAAGQPSGENLTVVDLAQALAAQGVEVSLFRVNSDDFLDASTREKARSAARLLEKGIRRDHSLVRAVETFMPDIVQLHNTYPLIPMSAVRALGVPVTHVLHNYRHSCIAGTHLRKEHPCFDCLKDRRLSGIAHACYRSSRTQSALLTVSESRNAEDWRSMAGYTAISQHMATYARGLGVADDKVPVIYNAVPDDTRMQPLGRSDLLFVGRLTAEKGLRQLLAAWSCLEPGQRRGRRLHIAGAGPLRAMAEASCAADRSIEYHGLLAPAELHALMLDIGVVVVPSLWDEPFGRVVAEAFQQGRPVITSDRGALPELVSLGAGASIAPTVANLHEAIIHAGEWNLDELGRKARRAYDSHFTPETMVTGYLRHFDSLKSMSAGPYFA